MGRIYIKQMSGRDARDSTICKKCLTPLTNKENLESTRYQGATGPAYLYTQVVNLNYGPVEMRTMISGKHYVRDVFCKGCNTKIGWMYEFAFSSEQRHKEGKVILERVYIKQIR